MLQHVEAQRLECLLVIQRERQSIEIGPGALLDPAAQHVGALARSFGYRLPRQVFAQQQRKRHRQRHFIRAGGASDRIAANPHGHCRIEIVTHPGIGLRTEGFVANLFDQIITGPRRRIAGRSLGVERLVVVAQLERHRIRITARFHRLFARQVAARHRHPQVLAIGHGHIGRPRHLKLRLVRNRPAGAG